MGFVVSAQTVDRLLADLSEGYRPFAPKRFVGGGVCSDTDRIRYREISTPLCWHGVTYCPPSGPRLNAG